MKAQQPSWHNVAPPTGINAQQNLDALGSPAVGGSNVVIAFDTRYRGFLNSPYLLESWSKGELIFRNGAKYVPVELKFNTYSQDVLVRKSDTGDSVVLDKTIIQQFTLVNEQGQSMLFRRFTHPETKQTGFFHVLFEGNYYLLLAHYRKTLLKADYKGAYSAERYYDEFVPETTYFLVTNSGATWQKLKTNEKSLLKALNDIDGKLKEWIKSQGLHPSKNQSDLVQVIQRAEEWKKQTGQ
ncbi:MAG: hypothetical protein RMJ44_07375 [Cytophagales bacterium]|nr:hypothetical protein [Bernardetiaceae bacterium]MDW8210895.1 hypothetical protein [Cytophagales bacterium]